MENMIFVEMALRFSAVGLLIMLALLTASSQLKSWPGRLMTPLAISLAALLLGTAPSESGLSRDLRFLFRLVDVPNTILVWLLAKSLLNDDFKMSPLYWLLAALYCIPLWIVRLDLNGFFDVVTIYHVYALNAYALALFIYLLFDIIRNLTDDLVEPRRKLRIVLVFAIVVLTIVAITSEFILIGDAQSLQTSFKLLVIYPLLIAIYFWMFKIRTEHFSFQAVERRNSREPDHDLNLKDAALLKKLNSEMQGKEAWRQTDLTIKKLSARLGTTEHSLRYLINQRLGYRNFSAYVNEYRIKAIKLAFFAPETIGLPILTIALDNGFNSLPPFNRAFKSIEGVTPRLYRAQMVNPGN